MHLILSHGFVSVKGARFLSRLKSQVSSRVFYEMMMSAAASEAKDAGADAIVRQSTQFRAGTPYVPQPTQSFGGGYAGGFAGGLASGFASGFANGIGMAQSINHLSGTYLAVKYVD